MSYYLKFPFSIFKICIWKHSRHFNHLKFLNSSIWPALRITSLLISWIPSKSTSSRKIPKSVTAAVYQIKLLIFHNHHSSILTKTTSNSGMDLLRTKISSRFPKTNFSSSSSKTIFKTTNKYNSNRIKWITYNSRWCSSNNNNNFKSNNKTSSTKTKTKVTLLGS